MTITTRTRSRVGKVTSVTPNLIVLVALSCANVTYAAEDRRAERLYSEYCSVCHGDNGDGNTRVKQGLVPPPRDFTTAATSRELTRERMIDAVKNGRPGTAMAAWARQLNDAEIALIVDYIRDRFMQRDTQESARSGKSDGASIYASTCSVCHGDRGTGAVWGRTSLKPPPANFTTAATAQRLSRETMIDAVTHGRPGTAMAAFGSQLTPAQIEAVVDYIRTHFMPAAGPIQPLRRGTGSTIRADAWPDNVSGNAETGKAFYLRNCVACHGTEGAGNGPRAYFIFPKPRNFLDPVSRARFDRGKLFAAIKHGVVGREMPAWGKVLTDQQIADITEYVFQAFIDAPPTR